MATEMENPIKAKFNFVDRGMIKKCVHCGLCLSYCPTYKLTGSELDSPRGRVYQMRALQEGRIGLDNPDFRLHIDRCLNCRACETACPSGVQYGQLLEATRAVLPPRTDTEKAIRDVVLHRAVTSPSALDFLGTGLTTQQTE